MEGTSIDCKNHQHMKNKKNLGLERRLKNAEEKLHALTPPRGPGKRQIKEEEKLTESV